MHVTMGKVLLLSEEPQKLTQQYNRLVCGMWIRPCIRSTSSNSSRNIQKLCLFELNQPRSCTNAQMLSIIQSLDLTVEPSGREYF